jgi:methionyl aminopeptidase
MIIYKSQEEIGLIREGGHIMGEIMDQLIALVVPGVTTGELEDAAEKLMIKAGGTPAFKGYRPSFAVSGFPSALCTSINHEIVHAPAVPSRKLKEGDVLGIDVGFFYKGFYTDMARTVPVGKISAEAEKLLRVTQEALAKGIEAVQLGQTVYEIGAAVEDFAKSQGVSVITDLVGHGVGKEIHEDPSVPNFRFNNSKKHKIAKGMVIAIEPMLSLGRPQLVIAEDDWTYQTKDGSLSAQFENTVAINHDGTVEILTPTKWKFV